MEDTSKSVLSTLKLLVMFPDGVDRRKRVSVYDEAGLLVPDDTDVGTVDTFGAGAACPARSAFSRSALILRSSLSAAILSLIFCLASMSSCFSFFFLAAARLH